MLASSHLAKGLEFRAVIVMACDDEVIPLQERIETVVDDESLGDVYSTERHLLYVACIRARDYLLATSAAPASEFLDDLQMGGLEKPARKLSHLFFEILSERTANHGLNELSWIKEYGMQCSTGIGTSRIWEKRRVLPEVIDRSFWANMLDLNR